jgi:recombinational DNA repair protein (RecF pathway)
MLSNKKKKDAAMAALMKRLGIERNVCNCAICHHTVGLSYYELHLLSCKGR